MTDDPRPERALERCARFVREAEEGAGEDLCEALRPHPAEERPAPRRMPAGTDHSCEGLARRRAHLCDHGIRIEALTGAAPDPPPEELAGSIEYHVGWARVPVGVIGPLRVNGGAARGDFFVPLATTEGTLVASLQMVANVVGRVGGVSALCSDSVVGRVPCFGFADLARAARFVAWLAPRAAALQETVARTSRHCRLADLRARAVGNEVHVWLDFETGDAAGQNMVTLAADAICRRLLEEMPDAPRYWRVEASGSADKKASVQALLGARGRRVDAEVTLPAELVRRIWRLAPAEVVRTWSSVAVGALSAGALGLHANYGNAVAALFLACGQDVACVAEAALGISRFELADDGGLYVSATLPNLIVGTVGGGTHLPTARECLAMMDCAGSGRSRKLAEICGAVALLGEVACITALSGGGFAQAHATGGRRPVDPAS